MACVDPWPCLTFSRNPADRLSPVAHITPSNSSHQPSLTLRKKSHLECQVSLFFLPNLLLFSFSLEQLNELRKTTSPQANNFIL